MTIEHVVVLMLENRSFDSMLGKLYPTATGFNGLTGQETNIFAGQPIPVWTSGAPVSGVMSIPDPDPGELFTDMTSQLFGAGATPAPPPMSGFAANYMAQAKAGKSLDPRAVMHYFMPEQVPVLSALARAFGVCDQWHASAPCQTWPNRFFTHTGTALGYVDNSHFPVPFPAPSIFRQLQDSGATWRVYFHDVPQSLLLGDIWLSAPLRYRFFNQFLADAQTGALPNYSFIEPRYFTDMFLRAIPNDAHPPHNVLFAEQLIAAVYNAVRQSSRWTKTLLIITCDEHGGCFDHVAPPMAVPPDGHNQDGFAFDRYGVRVPAVIVSPYIPEGSIVRAALAPLPFRGPPYPFDHTSILATLRKLFNLGPPLTAREAAAPDLLSQLSLATPANLGPEKLVAPGLAVPMADAVVRASAPPNQMQTNLARMAASLPASAPSVVPPSVPMVQRTPKTVAIAAADSTARVKQFLNV